MDKMELDTSKDRKGRYENCQHINQYIQKDSKSTVWQICYTCKQELWVRKDKDA